MTRPSVRRTPNRRGEGSQLREDLLAAALHLVDAEGSGAVSLRAVARGAGVSAPSTYLHFANLDSLMAAVVARCFEALVDEICKARNAHADLVERLLASCRGYLHYAEQFPGRYALIFGRAAVPWGAADTLIDNPAASSERAFTLLVDAVTACLDLNGDSAEHSRQIATAIWVGLDGYANLRVHRPHFPWPDPETMLQRLVLDHARPPDNP